MSLFTFGIGTVLGAGAGYLAAIFLAPGTGEENQKEMEEKGKELYQQAQQQGEKWVKQAQDQADHLAQQASDKAEEVKSQLQNQNTEAQMIHASRIEGASPTDEVILKEDEQGRQLDVKTNS